MLNLQNFELLHRHGENAPEAMTEHTVDAHDSERSLLRGQLRGARIFRCEVCADEVLMVPTGTPDGEYDAAG